MSILVSLPDEDEDEEEDVEGYGEGCEARSSDSSGGSSGSSGGGFCPGDPGLPAAACERLAGDLNSDESFSSRCAH